MAKNPVKGPWARLYAGIINDSKWLAGDRDARLCFMTSIALGKGTAPSDGRISLRAMIGIQWGAMEPHEVKAAADTLVALGLWTDDPDPDTFWLTRWERWQDTEEDQAEARHRKRIGALKTNHGKGQHRPAPVSDCPLCYPQPVDNSESGGPVQTGETPGQAGPATSGPLAGARQDKTRQDKTRRPPNPPQQPGHDAADPDVVVVGDQLIEIIGLIGEPATPGERRYIARALDHGWTRDDLIDLATEVAGKSDLTDPREYLGGGLRRRANNPHPNHTPTEPNDGFRVPTIDELIASHHERYTTTEVGQ